MRKILQLFLTLTLVFLLLPSVVQAQERTITGTILADDGKEPLSGVTIRVKGTRRIVTTDASGKFSIKVNPGEVLQVSFVGYETQDVKPGSGETIGVSLKTADNTMGEVVVTAMDQKRNPRELGFSVQKVSGSEIAETQRENFLNSLDGRVSGLTLTETSGAAGASSSIVLRGFNSLSLSNQPLFVVDGVVVDNQTVNETSGGGQTIGLASDRPNRNNDYQNRIADISPSDIETITVLKGPEATALYGSQASSGAILITTKRSKSNKLSLQYDNSFRVQEITRFPEKIDNYANGRSSIGSNTFVYFGPEYPAGTKTFDNQSAFFRTGFAQTHNLGLDFGFNDVKFRVSGSYFNQKGVVPQNDFTRITGRITNTTKLLKGKIELLPSFTFTKSDNNKVLRSAGGYLLSLYVWPSTNDIRDYENTSTGDKLDVFSNLSTNGEYDNPLFNVNKNRSYDETSRYTSTLGININPFKGLTINGRFGYDRYNMEGYVFFHPQSFYLTAGQGGTMDNYWRKYEGYNHTITATYSKKMGKNFNLRVMGGTMWQDYKTSMFSIYGTNIVDSVGGITNLAGGNGKMYKNGNFVNDRDLKTLLGNYMDSSLTRANTRVKLNRNNYGEYNYVLQRQMAYFGEVSLSFRNLAFLTYTHRFEESSTLPKENRKYNYPGASLSIILSDLAPGLKKGNIINYWKLRTSLAGTARLNSPYTTQSGFVVNFASGGGVSLGFVNDNPDLKPEKQKTYELGTEIRMFKSRLTTEITYYNTLNVDQILEGYRQSYGQGFVLKTINGANTRNQGVEIALDYTLIKKKDFSWNTRINFNRMWNRVLKMPENVLEYYIADTWLYNNARGGIMQGRPTTSITAFGYARNNAGDILISPTTGLPVIDGTFQIRGDRNPDFTLGWNNSFRWKNWSLNMLWNLKVGGDIFNGTNMFLTQIGKSKLTENRYTPRVINGVLNDGLQNSANPTQNTIAVIPAYNDAYYLTNMPEEAFIEKDVNWFRLRDITLSYTFRPNFIKGIKNLGFFVTGNDLILLTNYSGADPASNGNTAANRGVGGFGFDYAALPTPVSVNFGIKASF
jgi:TonB-linked SusC/RagA family outer membrane protein